MLKIEQTDEGTDVKLKRNAAETDYSVNPEKETRLMGVDAKQTADLHP